MTICKACGADKPLLRSGMCSACMRAIPMKDKTSVSYSAGASVPGLDARIAAQAETTEKLSGIVAGLADTMKQMISADDEEEESEIDENDSAGVDWGSSLLIGVCLAALVVVAYIFRSRLAGVNTPAPVVT